MISFLLFLLYLPLFVAETAQKQQPTQATSTQEICNPNNLNLRNASGGEFFLLNDGSFRYQLPNCRLRRFRVNDAAKCLRGTHLVFMGDSLSRYFYLNLAGFFAQGKWPMHFISQWPNGRSFLSEKEYNSWNWFYKETNRALNNGNHAMELCDCARNESVGFFDFIRDMFENRHFRYTPHGNLDDQVNDVRLSYIQWWGLMPMRGHREISLHIPRNKSITSFFKSWNEKLCPTPPERFWPLSRNCSNQRPDIHQINFPDFSNKDICKNYPNATIDNYSPKEDRCQLFEKHILGPLGATHVMVNTGWHDGLEHVGGKTFLQKLTDAAPKYFAPTPVNAKVQLPKVTWRQTTKGASFENDDNIAMKFQETSVDKEAFGFFSVGEITGMLRKIDDLLRENLDGGQKDKELQKLIKVHASSWPAGKMVNASTVHLVWHDQAHFEPYVYNEINNLFLNAICPLHLGATTNKATDTGATKSITTITLTKNNKVESDGKQVKIGGGKGDKDEKEKSNSKNKSKSKSDTKSKIKDKSKKNKNGGSKNKNKKKKTKNN